MVCTLTQLMARIKMGEVVHCYLKWPQQKIIFKKKNIKNIQKVQAKENVKLNSTNNLKANWPTISFAKKDQVNIKTDHDPAVWTGTKEGQLHR